jgi:hypothetical protein
MRFWRTQLSIVRGDTFSSLARASLRIRARRKAPGSPTFAMVWFGLVVITLWKNVRLGRKLPISLMRLTSPRRTVAPESLTFSRVWCELLIYPVKKCPIKQKTSALAASNAQQRFTKRRDWGSLAGLAKLQGCSQRTIREWCKGGSIPEAYQTRGGQWRIQKPLSGKTRWELARRRDDWPFKGIKIGEIGGDFSPDIAERLLLTQLFEVGISETIPVPYLAELDLDLLEQGLIKQPIGKKEILARRIQDLITERLEAGKSFSDLLLKGWVYFFWRENKKCYPTVAEIAQLMGISRDTFYRRGHTSKEIARAYYTASGESKRDLPDLDGLDSVQRANRNARKRTFASLQHDY